MQGTYAIMSSSSSPCAACKLQRRKCTQECIFAPYFPADQPHKFAYIHKVFGASNVAKLLNELSPNQREDAVQSLAYEAESRLRDPIYGCVGFISILQQRLKMLQAELVNARKELATYVGPQAMISMMSATNQAGPSAAFGLHMGVAGPSPSSMTVAPHMGAMPMSLHHQAAQPLVIREPQPQAQHQQQPQAQHQQQPQAQHQHLPHAQHQQQTQAQYQQQPVGFDLQAQVQQQIAAAAAVQQEMYRGLYERQRQQQDIRFNGSTSTEFDGMMLGSGYNHPDAGGVAVQAAVLSSVGPGGMFEPAAAYHIQQPGDHHSHNAGSSSAFNLQHPDDQHDFRAHLSLQAQNQPATALPEQQEQQGSGSDEGGGCVEGPSC